MTTIDNTPEQTPQQGKVTPTAFRYGLYGGLAVILISLIFDLGGFIDYAEPLDPGKIISSVLSIAITAGAVILAIKYHRDQDLGGKISFGRALGVGTLTALFMGIITAIFTYISIQYINTDVMDVAMDNAIASMEERGMDEDQIEEAVNSPIMGFFMSPGFFALSALMSSVFFGFIVSLIGGAIMKRD